MKQPQTRNEIFEAAFGQIARWLTGRKIEKRLQTDLEHAFPVAGAPFQAISDWLRLGFSSSLGQQVDDATRYAHLADATPATCGFSVDAVQLTNVRGHKHIHPRGEIDMIISVDKGARFDGRGSGWLVYPPGSGHRPTVSGGTAIVLFMLPGGEMTFPEVGGPGAANG
jgi:hypothetical protein